MMKKMKKMFLVYPFIRIRIMDQMINLNRSKVTMKVR